MQSLSGNPLLFGEYQALHRFGLLGPVDACRAGQKWTACPVWWHRKQCLLAAGAHLRPMATSRGCKRVAAGRAKVVTGRTRVAVGCGSHSTTIALNRLFWASSLSASTFHPPYVSGIGETL